MELWGDQKENIILFKGDCGKCSHPFYLSTICPCISFPREQNVQNILLFTILTLFWKRFHNRKFRLLLIYLQKG